MPKIIFLLALLGMSACTFFPGVHKIDIQQGNLVPRESVDQLRPGMTPEQVRFLLGTPLLEDTFSPRRWDYIYRLRVDGELAEARQLRLYFENGKLARIVGDQRPG